MRLSIHPAITCPSIPPLNVCSSIYLYIYCLFRPSFPHPPIHRYFPSFISSSVSATIHTSTHQSILPSVIHSYPVNNSICLSIRLQLFLCYHSSIHPSSSMYHLFTIIWLFLFTYSISVTWSCLKLKRLSPWRRCLSSATWTKRKSKQVRVSKHEGHPASLSHVRIRTFHFAEGLILSER